MKTRLLIMGIAIVFGVLLFSLYGNSESDDSLSAYKQPDVSYADAIFMACKTDNDCTIDNLQKYSQNSTKQTVLNTIDELITLFENGDFYCHPNAHHVGEFLYGFVERDLDIASRYVDSRCASGVLHGLVDNTIAIENLLYDTPVDEVDYVAPCETIGEKLGAHAKLQCIHGIGHSIIKIYDYDTIEAVKECHTYEKTSERFMCRGGLFMQNMKKYTDDKGGDFDDSDIYYPCNKLDDSDADLCYRYKSQYFLINNNYNATDTFRLCNGIGDPDFVGWCYKGAGSHLAKEYFYDIDRTAALCNLGNEEYYPLCVKGAIESIMRYVSPDYGPLYCEKIDPVLKNDCIKRMNEIRDTIF